MNTTLDELHYRRGEVGAVAAEEVLDKARGIVGSGASGTFCSGRQHWE